MKHEKIILQMLDEGYSYGEIAEQIGINKATVAEYVEKFIAKR